MCLWWIDGGNFEELYRFVAGKMVSCQEADLKISGISRWRLRQWMHPSVMRLMDTADRLRVGSRMWFQHISGAIWNGFSSSDVERGSGAIHNTVTLAASVKKGGLSFKLPPLLK